MVEVLESEINFDMTKLQKQKSLHRLFYEEKSKRSSIELPPTIVDPKQTQDDDDTKINVEISSESIKNLQDGVTNGDQGLKAVDVENLEILQKEEKVVGNDISEKQEKEKDTSNENGNE